RYVTSAMTLVRLELIRITGEAYATRPERAAEIRSALHKILDVELSVMLETYRDALMERVSRVERLEREGIARKLADAEVRYRDAIESAYAMCFVLDDEKGVLLWNRRAAELVGYDKDEMLGQKALDLLVPDEDARARILAVT